MAKRCTKGLSCGSTCIYSKLSCRKVLEPITNALVAAVVDILAKSNDLSDDAIAKAKVLYDSWTSALPKYQKDDLLSQYGETAETWGFNNEAFQTMNKLNAIVIGKYSEDSNDFNNSGIRDGNGLSGVWENSDKAMILHLDHALEQLPSVEKGAELWRGLNAKFAVTKVALLDKYEAAQKAGSIVTEPAFLSTTRSKAISENFSDDKTGLSFKLMTKANGNGKDISGFALASRFFEGPSGDEKEVLFSRDTPFSVIKVDRANSEVWLQEQ